MYVSVSYKIEKLSKHCFLGKENYDKSFHRWLKIFETFPEGVAVIREDGTIQYANKSLNRLLDIDGQGDRGEYVPNDKSTDNLTMKDKLE